ncbi:MAG: hypothetical protein ACTSXL_06160 [Alphaproteobacteria bacterium]
MSDFDRILKNIKDKIADRKKTGQGDAMDIFSQFLLTKDMEILGGSLTNEQIKDLSTKITDKIVTTTGEAKYTMQLYNLVLEAVSDWNKN